MGKNFNVDIIKRFRSIEDRARVARQELEHVERTRVIKEGLSKRELK